MIRSILTAAAVLAAPAVYAQSWGPTSADDPWGPYGSQMCSAPAGDPERFCMAVFCTEPGGPLIFGYSNAAQGGEGDWDVSLSVGRRNEWPITLSMQPGFGYAVGVAPLDPGRYPGLYQSIRVGSWLYLDVGGEELGLTLRRSNAEMARLESVCSPLRPLETDEIEITLIGPRRPDGPPDVLEVVPPIAETPPEATAPSLAPAPDATVDQVTEDAAIDETADPAPAPMPDAPQDEVASAPETASPSAAAEPAMPVELALDVGAAEWTEIPDDGEVVHGMRLCLPGTPGAPPDLCLNLGCYEDWREVSILLEHGGMASELWTGPEDFPVIVSGGADAVLLPLSVNPDADTLIAAGLGADADLPGLLDVLDRDGPLRIDLPFARLVVTAGGSGPAVARLRSECEVPGATEDAVAAAPQESDPTPEPEPEPALEPEPAPRSGTIVTLDLSDAAPGIRGDAIHPTFAVIHGDMIDIYRMGTGDLPEEARFVVHEFPAGAVAFSQLCGGAGWFGPRGCMGYVHRRSGPAWVEVFSDTELPYGRTVALDMGNLSEGWPDILVDGGAVRWRFVDREYRLIQ